MNSTRFLSLSFALTSFFLAHQAYGSQIPDGDENHQGASYSSPKRTWTQEEVELIERYNPWDTNSQRDSYLHFKNNVTKELLQIIKDVDQIVQINLMDAYLVRNFKTFFQNHPDDPAGIAYLMLGNRYAREMFGTHVSEIQQKDEEEANKASIELARQLQEKEKQENNELQERKNNRLLADQQRALKFQQQDKNNNNNTWNNNNANNYHQAWNNNNNTSFVNDYYNSPDYQAALKFQKEEEDKEKANNDSMKLIQQLQQQDANNHYLAQNNNNANNYHQAQFSNIHNNGNNNNNTSFGSNYYDSPDYQAALKFQQEEEANIALAQQLQQENNNYHNANNYHQAQFCGPQPYILTKEERPAFNKAHIGLTTYQDNMDVHAYNNQHVAPHKNVIIEVAGKMGLKKDIPVNQIIREIREEVDMKLYPNLETALTQITAHANGQVEPETGVKIEEILSMVWDLHKKLETMDNPNQFQYGNSVGGSLSLILHKIQENVNTQGGCKAGHAGRLIHLLAIFERAYAL